jgi:ABC transport system ATP-binding/permease protein
VLKLIIEDDEGRKTVVPFVREEITIGRQEGNTIRLTERNVSRRHARLLRQNGHVLVEDLGSYNGVRINGERIQGSSVVQDGDLIQIGDYDLAIQTEQATQPAVPSEMQSLGESSPGVTAEHAALAADGTEQDGAGTAPMKRRITTSVIRVDQIEQNRSRKIMELDASEAPRLLVLGPELEGREFACIRTELRIGRTEDNDIALEHRSLSRLHAKLVREDTGEWRVIDMQSANGLKVNGESYAQATLSSGDIIELGHVRLRFVGPGESTAELPYSQRGGRSSRLPLLLGLGALVVLVALAVLLWVLLGSGAPPPAKAQAAPPAPRAAPAAPQPPAADPATEALARARQLMQSGDLAGAEAALQPLLVPEGTHRAEAELLRAELQARQPKPVERVAPALASAELEVPTSRVTPQAGRRPRDSRKTEQASQFYRDGALLYKQGKLDEAAGLMRQCLDLKEDYALCHLLQGTIYAQKQKSALGAQHYRRFLQLQPSGKEADKVRQILEKYENPNR